MTETRNLRILGIRIIVLVCILTLFSFFINSFFGNTEFYRGLVIPKSFKPVYSGSIAKVCLIILVAFILINRKSLSGITVPRAKFKEVFYFSLLTSAILVVYYLLRYFMNHNLEIALEAFWFFVVLLYALILLFGMSLFVTVLGLGFTKKLYINYSRQVIYYVLCGVLLYFALVYTQLLWPYFSYGVGAVLFTVFSLFFSNVSIIQKSTGPVLTVENFSAGIGAPCSGIDSLLMFSALFIFIFILDYPRINRRRMLLLFPIGLAGTYLFNILRIFLLYLTGVFVSPRFAVGMFHQNIGWVLFIVYFFIFWWIASKFVYRKPDP
jgi:exosortase/archaeosortase family protein